MEDRLMDENTEDYLEILYWEFDSEKKKVSFSERDLFKAKMRGLIRTIQNTRATDQDQSEMLTIVYMDACADARRKYVPLLEKMAEALEELDDMFDPTSRVGEIINRALKEYRERKDAK